MVQETRVEILAFMAHEILRSGKDPLQEARLGNPALQATAKSRPRLGARVVWPLTMARRRPERHAMRLVLIIAGLVTSGVVGVGGSQNSFAQPQERLNSRIPAPIRAKYKAIRDAKDWLNPIITIRAEGIEIISRAIPGGRKTVAPGELRRFFVSLPVTAWPNGRVVLASDIGLRRGDRSDEEPIRRNHVEAENILKLLEVEIDWWPSG